MSKFTTFLLKISNRCNLDCSYCYVFKRADRSWVDQPSFMTSEIWQTLARKIANYALKHQLQSIGVNLHGGEPLLFGKKQTELLLHDFHSILGNEGINVSYGLQTNGTLLDQEWLDIFRRFSVRIGISIDGNQATHDRNRKYPSGQGSYVAVRKAIDLCLSTEKNREVFSGILAVINIESNPVSTLHDFLDMGVNNVDFLLPDSNYSSYPPGKRDFTDTLYGDWLIAMFDEYLRINDPDISIRIFDVLMTLCLGYKHYMDAFGITPIEILVVATNGDLHALDSLRASVPTYLGANILTDDLEYTTVNESKLGRIQAGGYQSLCNKCKDCLMVNVCGGGYLPHRYSNTREFDNPSIYCADLYKLIEHIKSKLIAMKQ